MARTSRIWCRPVQGEDRTPWTPSEGIQFNQMAIRFLAFAIMTLAADPARAQAQVLSPADTLSIVATSLETHVEERWLPEEAVVWLPEADRPNAYNPSREVIEALRRVIPGIRPMPSNANLYVCPDGGRPWFPVKSCPVLDDGRVLGFGGLAAVDDTTVELSISVATCCAIVGRTLRLRRTQDDGWEFVGIVATSVT